MVKVGAQSVDDSGSDEFSFPTFLTNDCVLRSLCYFFLRLRVTVNVVDVVGGEGFLLSFVHGFQ